MIHYKRTHSADPYFLALVAELDADLAIRDGDEHVFYAQLNKTEGIATCIVAYEDGMPVASGAIREFEEGKDAGKEGGRQLANKTMEVKRMYVLPSRRGLGLASGVLNELEKWASELGYQKCVLETGQRQVEALALYLKCGYQVIPNFGKYKGVENSVCFEKVL